MFIMALEELGVETAPILAGAGILGLAVGLGAQTLVGDVVSGFFILFEGMFLVDDRVRVGDVVGNVEEIGVRVLKVRDEFGVLHCIPNGEVRSVANHARGYVNAVVDFSLPYDEDIPGVLDNLRAALPELREEHTDILADPEFAVQELLERAVLIRALVRVKPGRDDAVAEVIRTAVLTVLTSVGVTPNACNVVKLTDGAKARQLLAAPQTRPERA
jgi:small-conductance mechanosensitive channel